MTRINNESKLTIQEINSVSSDFYSEAEWKPLINFFWHRYNKRYFNQIDTLQNSNIYEIRNNCGFIVATIDCILIETLEQFYSGSDESLGKKNHDPFMRFFQRCKAFQGIIIGANDAGKFAGLIRSGLLHQSKTKKASIINKKPSTPILTWIDENDKDKGFVLNRDKFHNAVLSEYNELINNLKKKEYIQLRKNFRGKLISLL